jgi:hypothetical protein
LRTPIPELPLELEEDELLELEELELEELELDEPVPQLRTRLQASCQAAPVPGA